MTTTHFYPGRSKFPNTKENNPDLIESCDFHLNVNLKR